MTHIKTQYGDDGTLKVTLEKDENDKYFNVVVKVKNKAREWNIVNYYKYITRPSAEKVFNRIYEQF